MEPSLVTAAGLIDSRGCGGTHFPWREWKAMAPVGGEPPSQDSFRWGEVFEEPWRQFGRSDPLTKIATAAVELLRPVIEKAGPDERDEIGVYMGTTSGSLEIDARYWVDLKQAGKASPMMFTYTLPSTALGAIAIRHGLRGPINCLLCAWEDNRQALDEALRSVGLGEAETVVCVYANAVGEGAAPFSDAMDERGRVESAAYAVVAQTERAAERTGGRKLAGPEEADEGIISLCERLCVPQGSVY